jgi:membrane-associated phospholipid phosphatase
MMKVKLCVHQACSGCRPHPTANGSNGMPSYHAQASFFFAATFSGFSLHEPLAVSALYGVAAMIAWSRIILGRHTIEQVVVGAVVGVCQGFVFAAIDTSIQKLLVV